MVHLEYITNAASVVNDCNNDMAAAEVLSAKCSQNANLLENYP